MQTVLQGWGWWYLLVSMGIGTSAMAIKMVVNEKGSERLAGLIGVIINGIAVGIIMGWWG